MEKTSPQVEIRLEVWQDVDMAWHFRARQIKGPKKGAVGYHSKGPGWGTKKAAALAAFSHFYFGTKPYKDDKLSGQEKVRRMQEHGTVVFSKELLAAAPYAGVADPTVREDDAPV